MNAATRVENNLPLVGLVMRKEIRVPLFLADDARQCGTIGLWRAARLYNPERGRWSTWACHCIWSAIRDYLRSRAARHDALPFVTKWERGADEEWRGDQLDAHEVIHGALPRIDTRMSSVLRRYYGIGTTPRTLTQIAMEDGYSHQHAGVLHRQGLRAMRVAIARERWRLTK